MGSFSRIPDKTRGLRSIRPDKPDAAVKEAIGEALREHYAEIAAQPVPDRFTELLDRLEASEASADAARKKR